MALKNKNNEKTPLIINCDTGIDDAVALMMAAPAQAQLIKFGVKGGMNFSELDLNVKSIEGEAFYGCKNLKSIGIPYSVESIEKTSFPYNTELYRK